MNRSPIRYRHSSSPSEHGIIAEESKKAKLAAAAELEGKAREVVELQEVLKSRDEKLAEAQKAQAELIKKIARA